MITKRLPLAVLCLSLALRWFLPEQAARADLLAAAAALLMAVPVSVAAWHSLRHPSLHGVTDRLVALAVLGAWASGDMITAALLPAAMMLGHSLEDRGMLGAREAIAALQKLSQSRARVLLPDGTLQTVETHSLRIGDRIELRAGDRVPVDGIVREGMASLDNASLTGESVPVDVGPGAPVPAGAIDTDGRLVIEVLRTGTETTLGRIIALMRAAENAKPPVSRVLERYAGSYMAVVLMVAAASWFATADSAAALAVLVSACPCALVLAAPATAIAAIAVAGRHGILIKGSGFLESLASVTSVVFDKTGTLTTGKLSLVRACPTQAVDEPTLLHLAASLGATSNHPVSLAASRVCAGMAIPRVEAVREQGGFGVTGVVAGEAVAFGRPDLFARLGVPAPPPPDHAGPVAGVSRGDVFCGWLLFADGVRPEAPAALADLRALGLHRQMLLTGDRATAASAIAAALGIEKIRAGALPGDKLLAVQAEIAAGYLPLVVGDGINDALALKAGAVGVAMGAAGTDVARASADLVLMSNDLRRLPTAIRLSRRCRRTIHVNVAIGLGWTCVLVGASAFGLLGTKGAVLAAVLHNLGTFVGLANSGRLLFFDEGARAG